MEGVPQEESRKEGFRFDKPKVDEKGSELPGLMDELRQIRDEKVAEEVEKKSGSN